MLLFLCSRIEAFRNNILFSPLRKPRFSYKHSRATEIQSQKLANQLRILNNIVILSIKAKDERIKGSWHVEGGINTLKTYTSCVNIITIYRYRRRRIKKDRKKKWQEVLNGLMRGISRGKWSEKVQWYGYRAAASFTRWKPWLLASIGRAYELYLHLILETVIFACKHSSTLTCAVLSSRSFPINAHSLSHDAMIF